MAPTIIYTKTDEAPALATASLLPIIRAYVAQAGIEVDLKDISLAARILAHFPTQLTEDQKVSDALAELGTLAKTPNANIIKLPNISASVPQLKSAIAELQQQGFAVPDYPEEARTDEQKAIKAQYSKVLGSAVNPVLREGNSDRRVAKAVKQYAKDNPHNMGEWSSDSRSHVAHMQNGDFYGSEKSYSAESDCSVRIQLVDDEGKTQILKEKVSLVKNEIIDGSCMSQKALAEFLKAQVADAKAQDVLFSVHLKATMMKVSDPILFGQAVEAYFAPVFEKFQDDLDKVEVDTRYGLGDLLKKIQKLDDNVQSDIRNEIDRCLQEGPAIAMVDSDKGITNLHVPSDVIIDASMPAAIRSSGKMWNSEGQLQDMKAIIPDRCYAGIYQSTIDFCKQNGAFDPRTMGSVANVGLMAKKAEEYGSHDKTFWIERPGKVQVVLDDDKVVFEHSVETGDIWRMCQTKDVAIKDWVKLAHTRAKATGSPTLFWLDENRSHDSLLIERVNNELKNYDCNGLDIRILDPVAATTETLKRVKEGEDTISVTGNVLRDYLTDLFPILELGTSAKMLSIVPLLAGGGLFETGAGGSAPKHVQQFVEENHLRWDSLGEFLALAVSLEDLGEKNQSTEAQVLAECLDKANEMFLKTNKSPSRKVGELDNRGSHFYLALFWAEALATQKKSSALAEKFAPLAKGLRENEDTILTELASVQGKATDMGGYFHPDDSKVSHLMRPSQTLNSLINMLT